MTHLETHHRAQSTGPLFYGLYPARVTKIAGDPDRDRQRIEVAFKWCRDDDGQPTTGWATMITPYADAGQGFQMLPEIDSTVVVGFFAGHIDDPYIIGSMWNGRAKAPDKFEDANNKRVIETRSGSRLEFDDTEGGVAIRLSASGGPGTGRHSIVLDDAGSSITIQSKSGPTVTITRAGDVNIEKATRVNVQASLVNVDAPMTKFSGVVMCQTLQAQVGVISPSYTPGAGNVW